MQPALSLHPFTYTDAAHQQAEVEALFRGGWIGVGRADVVAAPGQYRVLEIAGQSVILLRDRDGQLRAFANTCRHRAARLMNGAGTCRGIKCPFHAWAYRLDGTLAAAPQMDSAQDFDKQGYGLIAYRVEERAGFAFVCLNPDAPALDVVLGDFATCHADWPLAELRSLRRREFQVGCNWKAFLDVFNDYYHLPFVHPDSIGDIYAAPAEADRVTGQYASQFGATEGTGGLLQDEQAHALPPIAGLTGQAARGVRYTWVFPNMTFAAGTDALWVYEAYPLTPERCHVVQTACFPPETKAISGAETKLDHYFNRLDAALAEDVETLENQQAGLRLADAQPGPLHPVLEANVASFANWYRNRMETNQ